MSVKRFEVDRDEGKVLGVCAGLAKSTGLDVTVVRIGAVLLALLVSVPWILALYVVLGIVGSRSRGRGRGRVARSSPVRGAGREPGAGREESRERMRSLDLRMQAIETYVTSSNSRLAREIEELR
jgi:phage shock protein C